MIYNSLHQHSDASFLDSCNQPDALAKKASEVGMKAIALTDHGNVHNFVKMADACKKAGVKFIPGCEFYFTHDHKEKERKSRHLTILCRNNVGLRNIYALTTIANTPVDMGGGFFYRPRISWDDLAKHSEGLICLTGCMNSPMNHEFGRNQDYDKGKEVCEELVKIFSPDHLFVEMQMVNDPIGAPHRRVYIKEQDVIFEWGRRVASDLGLRMVATNDSHYLDKDDSFAHEILKCLDAKATLNTPVVDHERGVTKGRLVFNGFDYHVKSTEEMREKFTDDDIRMTEVIADMCDVTFESAEHMPMFEASMTHEKAYEMLVQECRKGWVSRGFKELPKDAQKAYADRIRIELEDIRDADLANYFLIVWDVLRFCRDNLIPVGPGRGSAAGSLVSYLLYITQVDPIKHGLLWERFWNRGRKGSMPDIDVDVSILRKDDIVAYIKEKFGHDRVFPMMTIGTMATAAAIKDVGKAIGLKFEYMNGITRELPHKCKNIEDAIARSPVIKEASEGIDSDTKEWEAEIERIKDDPAEMHRLIELRGLVAERKKKLVQTFVVAKRLEGCARQRGTHACALLIADQPIDDLIPLCWDAKKKQHITGFDMYDIEKLGFLKLDILGLKTLDVIADAHPAGAQCLYEPDKYFAPWDCQKTYQLLAQGRNKGVFQLESPLGKSWCKRMKPKNQEELCALVSLIRPAVLEIGMADDYLKNRQDPENIMYIHQDLEPIMEQTYGCQVYQEQMIRMVQDLAGWNLAEADALRKAVGKKIPEKLAAMKDKFRDGVKATTGNEKLADELWGWIEKGAEYGFNKSHAMCYGGYLGYITAYMKVHYPAKFILALLKFSKDEADSHTEIMELFYDGKLFGVNLLPPSIDKGNEDFELHGQDIFFGLSHIKHIGDSTIYSLKKLGQISWDRVLLDGGFKIKKDVLEALILSGAFDCFGLTRKNMTEQNEFLSELTDKEAPIFRTFITGGELTKTTKKNGEQKFTASKASSFEEAVANFESFIVNENESMKLINARRAVTISALCAGFSNAYKPGSEYGPREKAGYETYYLSVPLTCSEVDIYAGDGRQTHTLLEAENEFDKVGVSIIALVNRVHSRKDRNGRMMAFLGLQDRTFQMDTVMFSQAWFTYGTLVKPGKILLIDAYKNKGGLIVNRVYELE